MIVYSSKRVDQFKRVYNSIMSRAAGRVFVSGEHERHHILPRSLGGGDECSNIAILTYREHFLAHWLLTKFTSGQAKYKMLCALVRMGSHGETHTARRINSWQYELSAKANAEAQRGNSYAKGLSYKRTDEDCKSIRNRMLGNTNGKGTQRSDKFKKEQSERMLGNKNGKGNKGSIRLISSLIGNQRSKGYKHPKEFGERTRARMLGNTYSLGKNTGGSHYKARKVICKNDSMVFPAIVEAAKFYGVTPKQIRRSCRYSNKSINGLFFKFA